MLRIILLIIMILSLLGCSKQTYVQKTEVYSSEYLEFEYKGPLFNFFLPIYPGFYENDSVKKIKKSLPKVSKREKSKLKLKNT